MALLAFGENGHYIGSLGFLSQRCYGNEPEK
jgi:hypothetical protein